MGMQPNMLTQLVSFLLGASVGGVLLFFLSTAGVGSDPSTAGISGWANGTMPAPAAPALLVANHTSSSKVDVVVSPLEASHNTSQPAEEDELERLLREVADEHKTVIMTSVNEAWAAEGSLLDLFLESFRAGERIGHFVDHLLIVALDAGALRRCRAVHPHCYLLAPEAGGGNQSFSEEKVYMSKDYLDLVWSKVRLQQRILELGYNFLFTDVDIMWFRNPFERMSVAAHMVTSSDLYCADEYSPVNAQNTGFIYVKTSPRMIGVFEEWRKARLSSPGKHEQEVFNEIKFDLVDKRGLRLQFLDTANMAGFCNNSRDFNTLYTMHANCCVGLAAKLHDLKNLMTEWRAYMGMDDGQRRLGPVRWKVPGICIHDPLIG